MADIKQALQYAQQNPNTQFANELRKRIESGQMNEELKVAGFQPVEAKTEQGYLSRVGEKMVSAGKDVFTGVVAGEKIKQEGIKQGGLIGFAKQKIGDIKSKLAIGGGVARGLSSVVEEAPVVKQTLESVGGAIAPTIQKGLETDAGQKILEIQKQYPEAFKSLQDVVDIASLIPVGAGAKAGIEGVELATKGALKGVEMTGKGISKTGEKVFKSAIDYTVDEAQLVQDNIIKQGFLKKEISKVAKGSDEYKSLQEQLDLAKKYTPITRSDTALEKGLIGTQKMLGKQSGVEKLGLWKNNIEPALKNAKDKITKDELFARAKQTVESELEPGRKQALQDAYEALELDYKDFADTDLLTANKIKTSLDKFTPTKIFKGKEVASEYKTLKADLAKAIREKTYNTLKDVNIKKAYRDYANLQELEKIGIKALTESGLKGGFGTFWSTMYDMAATPIKTVGGQVLYRVGNKLEFIGDKGIKTLGDYIKKKGANLPSKKALSASPLLLQKTNEE